VSEFKAFGFTVITISGCVDTGGLGFVGQRKLIDQPRQPQ
jgi:hypothetical protein